MRKLFYYITAMVLGFLPQLALASAVHPIEQYSKKEIFSVNAFDPSKRFLEMLFGTVGSSLHGTSGMLMGVVFKVFNIGIIIVAGTYLTYATAKTVITTGQEGRFMGQQGKSGWLVLRTVLGFGLLTPSFTTGYSAIQLFIMWVVLQGVGFANTAWNQVVDYIEKQGPVLSQPTVDTSEAMDLVGTVMQMEVCMFTNQEQQRQQQADAKKQDVKSPDAKYFSKFQYADTGKSFRFPMGRGNADNGCGEISWQVFDGDVSKEHTTKKALQLVIEGLQPAASKIAQIATGTAKDIGKARNEASQLAVNRIIGASADWINVLKPLRSQSRYKAATERNPEGLKQFFNNMKERGWLYAGSYYYALGKLQGSAFKGAHVEPDIKVGPLGYDDIGGKGSYITFSKGEDNTTPKDDLVSTELQTAYNDVNDAVVKAKSDVKESVKTTHDLNIEIG